MEHFEPGVHTDFVVTQNFLSMSARLKNCFYKESLSTKTIFAMRRIALAFHVATMAKNRLTRRQGMEKGPFILRMALSVLAFRFGAALR